LTEIHFRLFVYFVFGVKLVELIMGLWSDSIRSGCPF
jgi:hypothetical protein